MSKIKDRDAGYAALRVTAEQAKAKLKPEPVQAEAPSAPSKAKKAAKVK